MDEHFKVAIFGSARIEETAVVYREVYQIAFGLGQLGFDVITGGGPGIMQAANAGHMSAKAGTHSIGLNIKLPHEQGPNQYLDVEKEFDRFSERLDTFMSLSDAVVVASGGIGTLLELFYSWQLVQVRHICETPIILFGDMWTGLLTWIRTNILEKGFMNPEDLKNIIPVNDVPQVVALIRQIREDREKLDHVCVNYEKYRTDLRERRIA